MKQSRQGPWVWCFSLGIMCTFGTLVELYMVRMYYNRIPEEDLEIVRVSNYLLVILFQRQLVFSYS